MIVGVNGCEDMTTLTISGLGGPVRENAGGKLPLDPRTYDRALACVHCGLCLPACPTYAENGLEGDSPRGRIVLIKGLADGTLDPTPSVREHLDLCLDCRACETACPSGVVYHELIEETRERLRYGSGVRVGQQSAVDRPWGERAVDWLTKRVFPRPTLLRLSLLGPRVLQRMGVWRGVAGWLEKRLPPQLAKMQAMLPERGPMWAGRLKGHYPSGGPGRSTGLYQNVAFFPGCVGSVLFSDVNRQSVELLQAGGCDVVVPKANGCCGAIHHHGGEWEPAKVFARRNIDAYLTCFDGRPPDAIVTNIAGCGAMLKEYDHLLREDSEYRERSRDFSTRIRDISEVLVALDLPQPRRHIDRIATYHDACHLAHAQGITAEPRTLLSRIPGLRVVDLPESTMCCGAAGTYNLTQPDMARRLARRKLDHIRSTGVTLVVTGNVGCAMQIESEAKREGMPIEVVHPVTLLHRSILGDLRTT